MAITASYIRLQRQIADELGDNQALLNPLADSQLGPSPIQNAIQQAIAKYEREPFYFNELIIQTPVNGPYPWQTVLGQEYYSDTDWAAPALSSIAKIDRMWVFFGGNRYPIEPRTADYLADVSINPAVTSYPTDYSYTAQTIRLYPIPNGQFPIGINGIQRFDRLANDSDSNVWTGAAFDLIRSEAKLILARDVLYDAEVEAASLRAIYGNPENPQEQGYLGALRAETSRRTGQGKIIPSYF